MLGRFRTAPDRRLDVRFLWGGDTAGQGWGIDLQFGGMKADEAMRQTNPDFFIHFGDNIYADGAMTAEVTDASGAVIWRNAPGGATVYLGRAQLEWLKAELGRSQAT